MKRALILTLAGLTAACGPDNSTVPMTALGMPVDTLLVPYTYIGHASWLGGKRWAFLAPNEKVVVLADLEHHTTEILGGPTHPNYLEPFALSRTGDSLYVNDWGMRSVTVWSLDGKFGRSITAASFLRGAMPQARDNQGRFYAQIHPPAGPDGSGNRDSAYVVVISADLSTVDTIGRLAPQDVVEVFGDAGKRFEPRALSGEDAWGVFGDGTLWIARVNQNRIDRRTPDGKWSQGQSLPDRVLQVLPQDRERFLLTFPEELRSTAENVPFAIIKPPFEEAFSGPLDRIWLVKSYSLADTTRMAQIVSPEGRLLQQIEYKGFGRLAGTDGEVGLVADAYEKGHRLLVYRLPQIPPTEK
ncbi:MAG: hypothetical protein ABI679_08040 [Gemmatimonadota bacterium]